VREQPQHADDGAEHGCGRHVAWGRTQNQRDPDRQRRVPEYARQRPEAAAHRTDLRKLHDPLPGREYATLRLLGETMDRSDLVEARRRRQPLRRLDRRRFAAGDRQEERGRKNAEARLLKPVGPSNQAEALFHRVHGLTDRAQRCAQIGKEEQKLLPRCRLQRRRVLRHLHRRGIGDGQTRTAAALRDRVERHDEYIERDHVLPKCSESRLSRRQLFNWLRTGIRHDRRRAFGFLATATDPTGVGS
jgi:hypothetical protein